MQAGPSSFPTPSEHDDLETRIEKACAAMRAHRFRRYVDAAKFYGIEGSAAYLKLTRRFRGLHKPAKVAHQAQQLLTPAQESRLVDWCQFLGCTGRPVDDAGVLYMAKHLRGPNKEAPGQKWLNAFRRRHAGEICFTKPAGLDPKRAQAFNFTTAHEHFELLDQVMKMHGIKWRNVYNMDEKGVQVGGGRKNLGKKFFYSRHDRARYKLRDANLELVTIIECVSADGVALPPGFVFQGKEHVELGWLEVSNDIWYGILHINEYYMTNYNVGWACRITGGQTTFWVENGLRTRLSQQRAPVRKLLANISCFYLMGMVLT